MAMAKARVTAAQNAEAPTIAQPERKSKDFQMPLESKTARRSWEKNTKPGGNRMVFLC